MRPDELTRRRLLAAVAAGSAAAVAGCGYQPAGGELDWTRSVDDGRLGRGSTDSGEWFSDGTFLYRLRNREGETFTIDGWVEVDDARVSAYDSGGDVAWSGEAERQYRGTPAVADGRVYLPLEDGSVTALEREEPTDDGPGTSSDDATVAWTASWDGAPEEGDDDAEADNEDDEADENGTEDDATSLELDLVAGRDLVVGTDGRRIAGFDAESGAERFAVDREALGLETVDAVAVAGKRTWLLGDGELRGVDRDGSLRTDRSVPAANDWLEATDSGAVLGADGELLVIGPDGDRRLAIDALVAAGAPVVVGETERLYHYGGETLTAVDVAGDGPAWTREDYSIRGDVLADEDGVYGQGTGPGMDECGLVGLTDDGEGWWQVPPLAELGCSGTPYLVGDRLVVRDGGELYGFRTEPGARYTVL